MIFIDTSAIIAILAKEPEAEAFTLQLDREPDVCTSTVVILEAVMRLSTMMNAEPETLQLLVTDWMASKAVNIVAVDGATLGHAVEAFARYGKGRHPARLNFADCLSYACAKTAGARLLYKGNDFAQTDMG